MSAVKKRLQCVYNTAEVIPFDKNSKFIIMSDCHRGQGNTGDNFLPNRALYFAALEYYYKNGFTYIELGDGDELWENRKIQPIISAHSDIFRIMSKFYDNRRLYMLYGNHDTVKRRKRLADREFKSFYCDSGECKLFPGISMPEGLVLEEEHSKKKILLVHGHQGSLINDTAWPVARFLVRYFWKPLELIGFTAPIGAARTHHKKEAIEKKLAAYAASQQLMLIAGHTHRPAYPQPGTGLYFNDGSCVHPGSITGIEIVSNRISLIKWFVSAHEDQSLYVERNVLDGPNDISAFYINQ
ncbi:MAG: metallophosphoesterase family protein [Clostridiales bacterium]|nr:metallophosphoesterase family protein [Clostridiales bacterium]